MNLITDRTWEDVQNKTPKGNYGQEDLNRVEQAMEMLYGIANKLGITPPGTIKTDWYFPQVFSEEEWPTKTQMQRYLGNITYLCKAVRSADMLPATMENLTYEDANNIEKALLLAYPRIQNALQVFYYSGEIFAGEELL